jgi:hypothetical protein
VISSAISVDFNHSVACLGEPVYFSPDTLVMNPDIIISWLWDFGDGALSTLSNPEHIYNQSAIYPVSLTVVDTSGCTNTVVHPVPVAVPPSGLFTYSLPDCINSPVQFSDISNYGNGQNLSWQWNFGDGQTSALQNPVHTYENPGTFIVCLFIQNECGGSTYCNRIMIVADPLSSFIYNYLGDHLVAFINQSTDEDSVQWNFGDGLTSDETNPVHEYSASGFYWVCLSAMNACNESISCQLVPVPFNVGINHQSSVAGIKLFPNPAKEEFTVEAKENTIKQVEIFTTTGVLTDRFVPDHTQAAWRVSLKGKTQGIYLVRFLTDTGFVYRRLIIQY